MVQVVTFTRTLANAGKYGNTAVLVRDVVDELLHKNGFADACAAEQTDFTALRVRSDQVDDFNARFEHFRLRRQIFECRRLTVNRVGMDDPERPLRRSALPTR